MLKKIFLLNITLSIVWLSLVGMEEKDMPFQLIILNGASCAGKSSLAEQMVIQLKVEGSTNVESHSLDAVCRQEMFWLEQKKLSYISNHAKKLGCKEDFYTVLHYDTLEALRRGTTVILDNCFLQSSGFLDCLQTFRKIDPLKIALVKVFCSKEVACRRFKKRNESEDASQHRIQSSFEQHYSIEGRRGRYKVIYDDKEYTGEIDTSAISPEDAASSVLDQLREADTTAFSRNYEKHALALKVKYKDT